MSDVSHVGAERTRGWKSAYEARGMRADERLIRRCESVKDIAASAAGELIDEGVTALFACNHFLEMGALKAMLRRQISPGVDLGFAGFDELEFADVFDPIPACVVQPICAIASLAASLLLGRIGHGFAPDGIHRVPCEVRLTESIYGGLASVRA